MTAVNLGITLHDRVLSRTPAIVVKNMIVEQDETNFVDGKAYISRPGSTAYVSPSGAGYRGCFQQAGLISSKLLVVSGTELYSQVVNSGAYTEIGAIPGTDLATFTASPANVMICADLIAYVYDGTTLTTVVMPSGEGVAWVAYLSGYFLLGVDGSNIIFFLADGSTAPDALDYFSAATNAGIVLAAGTISDQLVLFGQKVTEFWQASGDADLPFNRIVGQVYNRGIYGKFCLASQDNSIFFVGDDLVIYRAGSTPTRVSTNSIEEKIRLNVGAGQIVWSFNMDGHSYVVMTIPGIATYVFDVGSQAWYYWQTGDDVVWFAQYGTQINGNAVIAGSPGIANMIAVNAAETDDSGVPITREVLGGVPILGVPQRCNNFSVIVDSGGIDVAGIMEIDLRCSDDQGQTYSGWTTMSGGATGQYSVEVACHMLGMMRMPMRVFHLRNSNFGPFRISYARVNEYFASPYLFETPGLAPVVPIVYSIAFANPLANGTVGVPMAFAGPVSPAGEPVELAFGTSNVLPPTSGWVDATTNFGAWNGSITP